MFPRIPAMLVANGGGASIMIIILVINAWMQSLLA